jgi:hypothetical protein
MDGGGTREEQLRSAQRGRGTRDRRGAAAGGGSRGLNQDIRDWITTWNDKPKPYVWTKTADQILESIARNCNRINDSRH